MGSSNIFLEAFFSFCFKLVCLNLEIWEIQSSWNTKRKNCDFFQDWFIKKVSFFSLYNWRTTFFLCIDFYKGDKYSVQYLTVCGGREVTNVWTLGTNLTNFLTFFYEISMGFVSVGASRELYFILNSTLSNYLNKDVHTQFHFQRSRENRRLRVVSRKKVCFIFYNSLISINPLKD